MQRCNIISIISLSCHSNFTKWNINNEQMNLKYKKAQSYSVFSKISAELTSHYSVTGDWNRSQMVSCVLNTDKAG